MEKDVANVQNISILLIIICILFYNICRIKIAYTINYQ
jgi:hypothetical protein